MKNEDCRMSNFQTTEEEYRQYAKLATSAESLIILTLKVVLPFLVILLNN